MSNTDIFLTLWLASGLAFVVYAVIQDHHTAKIKLIWLDIPLGLLCIALGPLPAIHALLEADFWHQRIFKEKSK